MAKQDRDEGNGGFMAGMQQLMPSASAHLGKVSPIAHTL